MLPTMYVSQLSEGVLPPASVPATPMQSQTSSLEDEHPYVNQKFRTAGRAAQSRHDKEKSRSRAGDAQGHHDMDGYLMPVNQAKSKTGASPFR